MVKVFQDLLWTVCFVASGDFLLSEIDHQKGHIHAWTEQFWYKNIAIPLICLMPLWIRFNQCLRRYLDTGKRMPHLANAFKYAMSQSVTLFGVFHPLYLMHSRHEDLHTVSLTNDDDDDEQDRAIVIGNYRLNLFQVRTIPVSITLHTWLSIVTKTIIHGRCSPILSIYSALLDGTFRFVVSLQLLLGCLHGLGSRKTRIRLLGTTFDVPKKITILHGHMR